MAHKFKKKKSNKDRNKPCPCGSGKKYKKCCWNKEIENKNAERIKGYENKIESLQSVKETENISQKVSSYRLGWEEGTKDDVLEQLKKMVYENGEYPYIVEESEDRIEVHSICIHGVCRSGSIAAPIDFENVNGLWDSNESWDGDFCIICDETLCPSCGKKHALLCPLCHNEIKIELSEQEAIKAYKENMDIFKKIKCKECGYSLFNDKECVD